MTVATEFGNTIDHEQEHFQLMHCMDVLVDRVGKIIDEGNISVAFRLLDYPTVLIPAYKCSDESPHPVVVKKGKSCLFQAEPPSYDLPTRLLSHHDPSTEALETDLKSVPLYLMLLSMHEEAPTEHSRAKLVGTSIVPLEMSSTQHAMQKTGTFSVYNLMGGKVTDVSVVIRISRMPREMSQHFKLSVGPKQKQSTAGALPQPSERPASVPSSQPKISSPDESRHTHLPTQSEQSASVGEPCYQWNDRKVPLDMDNRTERDPLIVYPRSQLELRRPTTQIPTAHEKVVNTKPSLQRNNVAAQTEPEQGARESMSDKALASFIRLEKEIAREEKRDEKGKPSKQEGEPIEIFMPRVKTVTSSRSATEGPSDVWCPPAVYHYAASDTFQQVSVKVASKQSNSIVIHPPRTEEGQMRKLIQVDGGTYSEIDPTTRSALVSTAMDRGSKEPSRLSPQVEDLSPEEREGVSVIDSLREELDFIRSKDYVKEAFVSHYQFGDLVFPERGPRSATLSTTRKPPSPRSISLGKVKAKIQIGTDQNMEIKARNTRYGGSKKPSKKPKSEEEGEPAKPLKVDKSLSQRFDEINALAGDDKSSSKEQGSPGIVRAKSPEEIEAAKDKSLSDHASNKSSGSDRSSSSTRRRKVEATATSTKPKEIPAPEVAKKEVPTSTEQEKKEATTTTEHSLGTKEQTAATIVAEQPQRQQSATGPITDSTSTSKPKTKPSAVKSNGSSSGLSDISSSSITISSDSDDGSYTTVTESTASAIGSRTSHTESVQSSIHGAKASSDLKVQTMSPQDSYDDDFESEGFTPRS